MTPSALEVLGSVFFGCAVLHIFAVKAFQHLAAKYKEGSILENLFHLLGEVEIVFGVWAAALVGIVAVCFDSKTAVEIVEGRDFREPLFVFAIMSVAATRPVVAFAAGVIRGVSRVLPLKGDAAFFFATLTIGPLLGSLITEPAAMTVTALILKEHYFQAGRSERFKYMVLGTLFVNVSIGGVLTHFAAPPVLMVARVWQWDSVYMATHFGWKAALACFFTTGVVVFVNRGELRGAGLTARDGGRRKAPWWLQGLHLLVLSGIVVTSHYPAIFVGMLLLFLGLAEITKEYQDELRLKESMLVSFFLAGLVVLGGLQSWWLRPLVSGLTNGTLFVGATALTSFTDNAALTYLGAQVPGVSEAFKYALVAGAVAGGGLTVIANAPNPAGFAILRDRCGPEGISPARLFLGALIPTLVAMACFWFL